MPTPKKPVSKSGDPKPKSSVSKSSSTKVYLGGGKYGTVAQRDSVAYSRGYMPSGDKWISPKSKQDVIDRKAAAAKSNPAKGKNVVPPKRK